MKKRRIAAVTTSRADWSHLRWPLHDLREHSGIDLRIIATAAQLAPVFGEAVSEIERDGFTVDRRVESLLASDTDVGMAKTLGLAVLGLADALAEMRPDLLLLIADRYEMLAPAAVALTLRIPIAHIEGGEVSEGAIDNQVRDAITKMAHLHFTSTEGARARVIAMGEEPWRVHRAGAPSLDHLRRSALLSREELEQALGLSLAVPPVVVAYHPVTLLQETTAEADAVFAALDLLARAAMAATERGEREARVWGAPDAVRHEEANPGERMPILFCFPNADAGSHALMARVREFCARHPHARVFVNLPAPTYWSLLRESLLLMGNSSSGIMEAASLELPVVDIGMRQQGRERGANVLYAEPAVEAILGAVARAASPQFRQSLRGVPNMYGDGQAAGRITRVLAEAPLERLLHKRG